MKYLEVGEMVGGSLRVEGRERERGTSNQREKAGKGSLVCNGGNRRKRNSKGKAKKNEEYWEVAFIANQEK